jgi:hypothetical protein
MTTANKEWMRRAAGTFVTLTWPEWEGSPYRSHQGRIAFVVWFAEQGHWNVGGAK